MEKIAGKRQGTYLYAYKGYIYHIDKRYTHIYRCAKRRTAQCSGILVKEDTEFILQCEHNHPNEPYAVDIFKLKHEMIQTCKTSTAMNKEIFDTVCRKYPIAASYISYNSIRPLLSREKIKMRPSLPPSVSDLGNILQDYESTKFVYKGCAISEDNKFSYIFTSDKLLQIVEQCSEMFLDGTFSVVPRTPKFAQLFSAHVRFMDKGIAVLFILCEARTQSVYKSIWKHIITLAPDLQRNLRFIMTDFEKASMRAVHEQFPNATLKGCWFHYCQALLRKWRRLKLFDASYRVISMAMTLALAPPEMFAEGLNLMQVIADEESDNYPNILIFMKYMRSTWLPLSQKISVYGCPIRTNNFVESFHNILSQKLQTSHPNLWIFLDNISKLITDQEINYDRLINGLQITRDRCGHLKYKNAKIQKAQNYLSTGIYSLQDFLQVFDKDNARKQYKIALLTDDNNEVEIYADLCAENVIEKEITAVGLHTKAALNTITNTYTPFSAKYITQFCKQDINHDNQLDSLQDKNDKENHVKAHRTKTCITGITTIHQGSILTNVNTQEEQEQKKKYVLLTLSQKYQPNPLNAESSKMIGRKNVNM